MNPHDAGVTRPVTLDAGIAVRIAILLNLEMPANGDAAPLGWHFPLIGCDTPRTGLRIDGFPGLGIAVPPIPQSRLVAAGRSVEFLAPVRIGMPLVRRSTIQKLERNESARGEVVTMKVEHLLSETASGILAIRELQEYFFLDGRYEERSHPSLPPATMAGAAMTRPDATMLFQFSALSFNSHKIHLDREYARTQEGYPDLVVNGGLTTLLMTEFARARFGSKIRRLTVRNRAPLFCDRTIYFVANTDAASPGVSAIDDQGVVAATMEIMTDGD